jgi:hypothetical protein
MAVDDIYTKSLLHFNGGWTDESGKTWTAAGTAAIDYTNKKFGSGSGSAPYITTGDYEDFNLSTVDFTVDNWTWWNSLDGQQIIWSISNSADNGRFYLDSYGGNFRFMAVTSGETVQLNVVKSHGTINLNTWYHTTVVRYGNIWRIFKDGQQCGTDYSQSFTMYNLNDGPRIASCRAWSLTGNIKYDEFRWSKGIARWTSNFTPPTSEYGSKKGLFSFQW